MGARPRKPRSMQTDSGKGQRLKKISAFFASTLALIAGLAALAGNLTSLGSFWTGMTSEEEIQLIVQLATEAHENPDDNFFKESQYQVSYQSASGDGELRISYSSEYFAEQAKAVGILGSGPYFTLPKVGLDLKIVNNSRQTVFLSDAVLEVSSSLPDNRPLLAFTHHEGLEDVIQFSNDGWGEPARVQMYARIQGRASDPLRELHYGTLPGAQAGEYNFDITPLLESHGIPVDKIRQALGVMQKVPTGFDEALPLWGQVQAPCVRTVGRIAYGDTEESRRQTDQQLAASPYDCVVDVEGYVLMSWRDNAQAESSQRIEFKTTVHVTPPDALGAPAFGPTGSYDMELKTEGTDYTVHSPLSQPIEAGKFDRFILWLGAPRSSMHEFVLRLKFNNTGELSSRKISLQYLMPRSNRQALDELNSDQEAAGAEEEAL